MSDDGWGKPWTPEELAKSAKTADLVNPVTATPEELAAKGWIQTAHDEWEKIAPDTSPFAGAKMTITRDEWPAHPDQTSPMTVECERFDAAPVAPTETHAASDGPFYAVYFGKINYCVLAGPYATQDEAQAAIPATWERFVADSTFDFIFPHRDEAGLQVTTVRSVHSLKGAYGKV